MCLHLPWLVIFCYQMLVGFLGNMCKGGIWSCPLPGVLVAVGRWGRLGMVGLMHYSVLGPTPFCSGKTKTGMVQCLAWVLPAYAGCPAFCCAAASVSGARGAPSYRSETSTTAGDSSSVPSPACPCVSFLPSGLLYVPAPSHCNLYTWNLCNDAQGQPHVAADCWQGTGGALPQLFLSYSWRGKSNGFASP